MRPLLEIEINIGRHVFEGFKEAKKVYGRSFCKLNYINEGTGDSFSGHKTLSKLLPLYLEVKIQQVSYDYAFTS